MSVPAFVVEELREGQGWCQVGTWTRTREEADARAEHLWMADTARPWVHVEAWRVRDHMTGEVLTEWEA